MALSGDQVVRVSEIPGKRWELALETLNTGGAMTVLDADPPIGLQRYVGWPQADGRIHLSIFTEVEPPSVTQALAEREAKAGLRTLATAITADPRLADLLVRHGLVREYVYDYGNGAVAIGDVTEDGSVTLR